jgi:hypothetical protein
MMAFGYEKEVERQRDGALARLKEAVRHRADQDAPLSVVGGKVIVDGSTAVKIELTEEQRAVLLEAIERDKKHGVTLLPGPPTLTDAEREAVDEAADTSDVAAEFYSGKDHARADAAAKHAATLRGLLERLK